MVEILTRQNIRAKIESSPEHLESLGTFGDHDIARQIPLKIAFRAHETHLFSLKHVLKGGEVLAPVSPFNRFNDSPISL